METQTHTHTHTQMKIWTRIRSWRWLPDLCVCADSGELVARQRPASILHVWISEQGQKSLRSEMLQSPVWRMRAPLSGPSPSHTQHWVGRVSTQRTKGCCQPSRMGEEMGVQDECPSLATVALVCLWRCFRGSIPDYKDLRESLAGQLSWRLFCQMVGQSRSGAGWEMQWPPEDCFGPLWGRSHD